MTDPVHALEILSRLNAMGVQLSIDDFGTGYSFMAYLKNLPVHELNVDRSFVSKMTSNSNDAVIVHSTVDLGRNLGLRVVAEGGGRPHPAPRLTSLTARAEPHPAMIDEPIAPRADSSLEAGPAPLRYVGVPPASRLGWARTPRENIAAMWTSDSPEVDRGQPDRHSYAAIPTFH